jgi:UDP-N-acetylglucosamine acyltransferase
LPQSLAPLLDRLAFRYPSLLVDDVIEHEPGNRLVAVKNVTVNEEFFQGHFPGAPLMPGVLMVEALAQVATLLLLGREGNSDARVSLRGVNDAKFRKQVVPGDRLRLEVVLGRRHGPIVRARGSADVDGQIVAEAELILVVTDDDVQIDPSARVHPDARLGAGTIVEAFASIGPNVVMGRGCRVGTSAVVDGWTTIGDRTHVFAFASVGLPPQDLKYKGEKTTLDIGAQNIIREFVTIHRGTAGGGGRTVIGDRNLFMAYVHVAHDCQIGHDSIFGNMATLGGHVTIEDFSTISAGTGIHQFCRVGRHAFIGGYSVITKDALPFARTVGSRPARVLDVNRIGLGRRGVTADVIAKVKRSFRYLLQSKLNTSQALQRIARDPALACDEVEYLVRFIHASTRGVILKRGRKADEEADSAP